MVKLKRIIEGVVTNNQKGYIGRSMIILAKKAYSDWEMPKSRWTSMVFILEYLSKIESSFSI